MSGFERNMEAQPYTADEKRVCEYLLEITNDQAGCGSDPIGFLIASHGAINHTRKNQRGVIKALTGAVENALIGVYPSKYGGECVMLETSEVMQLRSALTRANELGE